jgi:hypothetical protein
MRTRGNGVGTAVHEVAEHASALARLEAELARRCRIRASRTRPTLDELRSDTK